MSEKIIENNGESAIARVKKRSMYKRQKTAIVLMAVAIVLLIAALIAVNYLIGIYVFSDVDGTEYLIRKVNGNYTLCYKNGEVLDRNQEGYYQTDLGTLVQIAPTTGDWNIYAVVDTEGTEVLEYGQTVLIYKELTYDRNKTKDQSKIIENILVHNQKNEFTFKRLENTNNFYIIGHEEAPVDSNLFAQLASACGSTVSKMRLEEPKRLENGEIDYAEYGLASVPVLDENGNETGEIYEPTWFIITAMNGDSYKVYIGDATVTGTGYYAKYEGRDTIYVLPDTANPITSKKNFTDVVLENIEKMLIPTLVYSMGSTSYFNVHDFIIYDKIDYDAIEQALIDRFGNPEDLEDGSIDSDEFNEAYNQIFDDCSHKVCHFSYTEMEERQNTMYSYLPYTSKLEYAGGYYINSDNIDKVLYALYATEFVNVEKLAPSEEDFRNYADLDEAPYIISFFYKTKDNNGETIYVENYVQISIKENEDGTKTFYAYSPFYDMIVSVSESSFGFLTWDEIEWYDTRYIQLDISYVEDVLIESPGFNTHFQIEDSASRYMTYIAQNGRSFTDGKYTYTITKDSKTGKYILAKDKTGLKPIYQGDYLVTPLMYTPGKAEAANYLFVETKAYDVNNDGTDDANCYYFYNVGYHSTSGQYRLLAQTVIADQNGQKLGEDVVWGEPYMTTDYFVTNSGYVYITDQDSYIGRQLDSVYGEYERGSWGEGAFFTTADGQYVLVDHKTGAWSVMDNISCNVYFADKNNSRLAQRSVKIPEIIEDGKVKRYSETYYPTTNKNLIFDNNTGKIQVVNVDNSISAATYQHCTIGTWSSGAYYATESGLLVVVNEQTGDWGLLTISANESYVAEVYANEKLLDYVIKTTNHVNRLVDTTAMENFQQLYGGMLYASIEGMADLTDEEKAEFRLHDDFDTGENSCQLKITIKGSDFYGNRRDIVYRFYQYSERKSYMTIEVIGENGESSSETAYGNFYVLRTFVDKMIEDAKRMVNAEEIDAVTKY